MKIESNDSDEMKSTTTEDLSRERSSTDTSSNDVESVKGGNESHDSIHSPNDAESVGDENGANRETVSAGVGCIKFVLHLSNTGESGNIEFREDIQ